MPPEVLWKKAGRRATDISSERRVWRGVDQVWPRVALPGEQVLLAFFAQPPAASLLAVANAERELRVATPRGWLLNQAFYDPPVPLSSLKVVTSDHLPLRGDVLVVAGSRRLRVWDVGRHNEPLDQVADIGYQNIAAVWSKRDRAHLKFADRSTTTFEASPSDVEQFVELVRSAMGVRTP